MEILLFSRSRVQPSSACSTCYCQICGEDSATNTCYSCSSSMYSGGSVLERKSSIKSISRIGDRTLALIDADSESSLESFGSIDSPKTAWKNANRTTVSVKISKKSASFREAPLFASRGAKFNIFGIYKNVDFSL